MTFNPLFLTASLTLGEKAALSGEMLLRGMETVFLVLMALWGINALFGLAFSAVKGQPKKPAEKKPAPKPAPAPAPKAEPAPAPVQTAQSDDAIIAAICAAIEAYRAEEGLSGLPYRVVSFKRKSGKKSWTGSRED